MTVHWTVPWTQESGKLLTRAQSRGIIKAGIRKRGYIGVKIIPVSELEANTDKYIELAQIEDVFIIENGKIVAKLTAYTE